MHNWKDSVSTHCISQSYKTARESASWIGGSVNSPIAELQ
jgi:hypothetical protein